MEGKEAGVADVTQTGCLVCLVVVAFMLPTKHAAFHLQADRDPSVFSGLALIGFQRLLKECTGR